MSMTLSRYSNPLMVSQGAGVCFAPFKRIEAVLNNVSMVRVDFPPPETPVTQTNLPKGKSTVSDCRLLPVALITFIDFPLPSRRSPGTAMVL